MGFRTSLRVIKEAFHLHGAKHGAQAAGAGVSNMKVSGTAGLCTSTEGTVVPPLRSEVRPHEVDRQVLFDGKMPSAELQKAAEAKHGSARGHRQFHSGNLKSRTADLLYEDAWMGMLRDEDQLLFPNEPKDSRERNINSLFCQLGRVQSELGDSFKKDRDGEDRVLLGTTMHVLLKAAASVACSEGLSASDMAKAIACMKHIDLCAAISDPFGEGRSVPGSPKTSPSAGSLASSATLTGGTGRSDVNSGSGSRSTGSNEEKIVGENFTRDDVANAWRIAISLERIGDSAFDLLTHLTKKPEPGGPTVLRQRNGLIHAYLKAAAAKVEEARDELTETSDETSPTIKAQDEAKAKLAPDPYSIHRYINLKFEKLNKATAPDETKEPEDTEETKKRQKTDNEYRQRKLEKRRAIASVGEEHLVTGLDKRSSIGNRIMPQGATMADKALKAVANHMWQVEQHANDKDEKHKAIDFDENEGPFRTPNDPSTGSSVPQDPTTYRILNKDCNCGPASYARGGITSYESEDFKELTEFGLMPHDVWVPQTISHKPDEFPPDTARVGSAAVRPPEEQVAETARMERAPDPEPEELATKKPSRWAKFKWDTKEVFRLDKHKNKAPTLVLNPMFKDDHRRYYECGQAGGIIEGETIRFMILNLEKGIWMHMADDVGRDMADDDRSFESETTEVIDKIAKGGDATTPTQAELKRAAARTAIMKRKSECIRANPDEFTLLQLVRAGMLQQQYRFNDKQDGANLHIPEHNEGLPLSEFDMKRVENYVYDKLAGGKEAQSPESIALIDKFLTSENGHLSPVKLMDWASSVGGPTAFAGAVQREMKARGVYSIAEEKGYKRMMEERAKKLKDELKAIKGNRLQKRTPQEIAAWKKMSPDDRKKKKKDLEEENARTKALIKQVRKDWKTKKQELAKLSIEEIVMGEQWGSIMEKAEEEAKAKEPDRVLRWDEPNWRSFVEKAKFVVAKQKREYKHLKKDTGEMTRSELAEGLQDLAADIRLGGLFELQNGFEAGGKTQGLSYVLSTFATAGLAGVGIDVRPLYGKGRIFRMGINTGGRELFIGKYETFLNVQVGVGANIGWGHASKKGNGVSIGAVGGISGAVSVNRTVYTGLTPRYSRAHSGVDTDSQGAKQLGRMDRKLFDDVCKSETTTDEHGNVKTELVDIEVDAAHGGKFINAGDTEDKKNPLTNLAHESEASINAVKIVTDQLKVPISAALFAGVRTNNWSPAVGAGIGFEKTYSWSEHTEKTGWLRHHRYSQTSEVRVKLTGLAAVGAFYVQQLAEQIPGLLQQDWIKELANVDTWTSSSLKYVVHDGVGISADVIKGGKKREHCWIDEDGGMTYVPGLRPMYTITFDNAVPFVTHILEHLGEYVHDRVAVFEKQRYNRSTTDDADAAAHEKEREELIQRDIVVMLKKLSGALKADPNQKFVVYGELSTNNLQVVADLRTNERADMEVPGWGSNKEAVRRVKDLRADLEPLQSLSPKVLDKFGEFRFPIKIASSKRKISRGPDTTIVYKKNFVATLKSIGDY